MTGVERGGREKGKEKVGEISVPGGGVPTSACTGRFRPKGVSFSGFRYMKG